MHNGGTSMEEEFIGAKRSTTYYSNEKVIGESV
jgi:hypothetical protein